MSRSLLFAAVALPGLLAGTALAQDTSTASADLASEADATASAAAAEADATTAQDAADAASIAATESQTAADAQAATEAQAAADAAVDAANTADTTAGDTADVVAAFRGGIRSIRILKNLSQEYRVTGTVDGEELVGVTALSARFEGIFDSTFVGPLPSPTEVTLPRTGASYDAMGSITVADDGSGAPVWDATYDLTVSVIDPGTFSSPVVLTGVPVGALYSLTGPPIIFEGTAYAFESIDWSDSADCYGCPIISLVDLNDPTSPDFGRAPLSVQVTADPVSPGATYWVSDFTAFDQGFDFESPTIDFDADALDAEYVLTATMFSGDVPIGEPASFVVIVEEDDTVAPEPPPVPTLVIDSDLSGSVTVDDGDYVVLQAQVGRNITVKEGGTLLIQGGVIGRDLKLEGGEVILADATIGRNLLAQGGVIEIGEAVIGRDLEIEGGVELVGDAQSLLVIGRNLSGRTADAVVLGGNIDVLNRVRLRAGDLIVNDTLWADDSIDLRVRGNDDGGLQVNGSITSDLGDVDLRSATAGGLVVSGAVQAEGDIDMRARGGDLTIDGTVTAAADLDLRVRSGDGTLTINGDLSASTGEIELRVNNGDGGLVVTGSIQAEGDVDMRVGTGGDNGAVLDGTIVSGASVLARGNTDFWIGGSITALGDVAMRARDSGMVIDGEVRAQGIIDLTSGTDTVINGDVSSSALFAADLGDGGALMGSISGGLGSFFGSIVVNSGGSTSIDGNVSATTYSIGGLGGSIGGMFGNEELGSSIGRVTIGSGTSTSIDGTVVAEADIFIDSGTDTTVTGSAASSDFVSLESRGDIVLNSGGATTINANVSGLGNLLGAGVSIYSNTTDSGGSGGGWMIVGGDVVFDATTTLEVGGDLTSGGDVSLSSGGATTINANVSGLGNLLGAGVSIYSNTTDSGGSGGGWMIVGGDVVFDATTTLEVGGDLTSGGDVSLSSGGATEVTGTVIASGYVDLLGTPSVVMSSSDLWGGDFKISGGQGVNISVTETLSMSRGTVESPGGSVNIQARGIVGRWSFDDAAAQDSSGTMSIQASNNVTIEAIERLELVGVNVQADQGSVTLRGDGCEASYGIDDVVLSPVLMVVSGGSGVSIEVTRTLEMAGVLVESSGGDIDILASAFRQKQGLPLDVPDTEFDAFGSISVGGTDYFELFGTYTWDDGAFYVAIDPTQVYDTGATASFLPGLGGTITDPGALLAAVTGG